ncbi:hypothetical protein HD806DRAFT_511826 [Xylariaceae sp. AK1471]|nr:hypothetical protein HD806DRAFT_511826 [Xylariaceae sp. AK1471]
MSPMAVGCPRAGGNLGSLSDSFRAEETRQTNRQRPCFCFPNATHATAVDNQFTREPLTSVWPPQVECWAAEYHINADIPTSLVLWQVFANSVEPTAHYFSPKYQGISQRANEETGI